MAIKRCERGHYYNDREAASCPYCSGESPIGKTIPLGTELDGEADAFNKTELLDNRMFGRRQGAADIMPTTVPLNVPEIGKTQFLDQNKNSEISPVRGWLVVIEGEKLGLDFRIHSGRNAIGRSKSNDICIDFDSAISKEKACFVIYDEKHTAFHIMAGESANNIYVNEEILLVPRKLVDHDIVEIGTTKLVFRSLCNDQFNY